MLPMFSGPIDLPIWGVVLLFLATVAAMEGVAYASHRWVMHGWLWSLHRSHHEPRTSFFEKNDWFAVMGAVPSIALIWLGVEAGWGSFFTTIGAGMAGYGAIYVGFHDIIVHRRIRTGYVPRSRYMKRMVQAHRLHHVVESKEGNVSFGFIYAPPVAKITAELQKNLATGRGRRRINPESSVESAEW